MDQIEFLEELVAFYDDAIATNPHPRLVDELSRRRREAEVELHGARGAAGLDPLTGKAE